MDRAQIYATSKWRKIRKRILSRDGYLSQESKRYGRKVEATIVHHIYPVEEYPELAFKPWNLISLSKADHNLMHDRTTRAITAKGKEWQEIRRREFKKFYDDPPH